VRNEINKGPTFNQSLWFLPYISRWKWKSESGKVEVEVKVVGLIK
jgi:hypothetical protein